MRSKSLLGATLLFVLAIPATGHAICQDRPSMTGDWNGNDGGLYRVRQRGKAIWWVGTSRDSGKTFINVFRGERNGLMVSGSWADIVGSGKGTLQLKVLGSGNSKTFRWDKVGETGTGFGGSRWSFPCLDTN